MIGRVLVRSLDEFLFPGTAADAELFDLAPLLRCQGGESKWSHLKL